MLMNILLFLEEFLFRIFILLFLVIGTLIEFPISFLITLFEFFRVIFFFFLLSVEFGFMTSPVCGHIQYSITEIFNSFELFLGHLSSKIGFALLFQ
ncbi:hypothetical protein RchiOBHm_Chr5g0005461 [Rosa chinensis]|uniref:Uncharacterized protein n=1 Tax=Rosa chinensis TaxID=74649 RepID=A0A2P6Q3A6_ROSCH|nr:hypothetical protein RchiOBHm_Chr5g0005461 [Rosa chinensis]